MTLLLEVFSRNFPEYQTKSDYTLIELNLFTLKYYNLDKSLLKNRIKMVLKTLLLNIL